jgi:hypothetical protein
MYNKSTNLYYHNSAVHTIWTRMKFFTLDLFQNYYNELSQFLLQNICHCSMKLFALMYMY